MTHVRTSPYYPQSNGKLERWHESFKSEGFRPGVPLSLDDGLRVARRYIEYYNTARLHSAIGYITPQTRLEGRQADVFTARDQKLEDARRRRAERRHRITNLLPQTA
ncbi:MAG: integrase core domain-containing protein [Gemmatimonadaceae bacterium]